VIFIAKEPTQKHNLKKLRHPREAEWAKQTVKSCASKATAFCTDSGGDASSADSLG
jgi:hypothetical protein